MGASFFLCSVIYFVSGLLFCLAAPMCTPEEIAVKQLAKANNELALKLIRQAGSSDDNVFFSPFSLSAAFGMLYYGTKGNTAKELRNALGYETAGLGEEQVHRAFHQFLTESLPTSDRDAYVLNTANAVLLDKKLQLVSSYKENIQRFYQASVEAVDFARDGPQIVERVNSWVNDKTNGKIDKLLDELSSNTALVLLNAVYFKGTWKTQFDKSSTFPQDFYQNGLQSEAKEVPMMRYTEKLAYTAVDDFQVVELPYKGENMSMIILLPNSLDGLASLEQSLTLDKLSVIKQQLYKTKVDLVLPKFKIEYSKEMSSDFQNLGAKSVFRPGADFSGLAEDKHIFVSQVLHKAVVEVNEEGSEAAAVTGVISVLVRPMIDPTPKFTANHPFLFAIVDKRNDMILFLGRVNKL